MPGDRLRVGIVGANVEYGWGTRAHIPALLALPEFELRAVATTRMATAQQAAAQFGAPLAFDDARAMMAHPEIDLVIVCVRVPAHHALTLAAIEAGKHVFCEWPLGANLAEATEMRDAAERAGVRHMVGLQGRGGPAFIRLRALAAEGYLGEVLSVHLQQTLPGAGPRRESFAWAADRTKGATTLSITAAHAIDAMNFALGDFAELSAIVDTRIRETMNLDTGAPLTVTASDHVLVSGRLAGGALVSVDSKSVPVHGTGFRLEVHGTDGMVRITARGGAQLSNLHLEGARTGEAIHELPYEAGDRWVPDDLVNPPLNVAQLLRRFGEAIREQRPADPDFNHAVRMHQLVDTIQRASDSGERVRVGA